MKILVTYDLEKEYVERIRRGFPTVEITRALTDEAIRKEAPKADVILAGRFNPEILAVAKNLKWVQTISAGVDRFLFPELIRSRVILTNARGIHLQQVSDHAMALMLAFTRRLNLFIRLQLHKKWDRATCEELSGKTLGIIGLGSIGNEIARKAKCFGMTVVAATILGDEKSPSTKPAFIDELLPHSSLPKLLAGCDFVVVSVPLTPATHHIIGEDELRSMKKESVLINISRGRVVDEEALVRALKEGWMSGAGLDVFENEPLPTQSELWNLQNVIITPHVAGSSPHYSARVCEIFVENLRRYQEGRPLINVINKKMGY